MTDVGGTSIYIYIYIYIFKVYTLSVLLGTSAAINIVDLVTVSQEKFP